MPAIAMADFILAPSAARPHVWRRDCITKVEVVEYEELGMEAIWKIEIKDFPAFIIVDDKGNDFFYAFKKRVPT